jgi:hypothetical protein
VLAAVCFRSLLQSDVEPKEGKFKSWVSSLFSVNIETNYIIIILLYYWNKYFIFCMVYTNKQTSCDNMAPW